MVNITVNAILKFPMLNNAIIRSGADAIDDKQVEWVSVMENPVENFVRENEFVLTTGIGCFGNNDELMKFVEDVYNSGASVLAIATGRHVFDIPEEIIEFAEKSSFIILEIPWELRFADLVHEIMGHLLINRNKAINRPKEIQEQLIQIILEGRTLQSITDYIEREIGKHILIADEKGEVVSGTADRAVVFSMWNKRVDSVAALEESHHPKYSDVRKIEECNQLLYQFTIKSNGKPKGNFFILTSVDESLSKQDITIAEQATVATALWFSRDSAVVEAEGRMHNEFLLSLVIGENMSPEHIQAHADLFKYNLEVPYVCIIGCPENLGSLIQQQQGRSYSRKTDLEYMNSYIKDGIFYAADSIGRRLLYAFKNDIIIIFLETSATATADTVNQFLDLVERRFIHLLPGVLFSWGVGKRVEGKDNFKSSYQKAKAALEMGRGEFGTGRRTHFDDTQLSSLLLNLAINEEVKQIALSVLSPLINYDDGKGMDLIKTFAIYRANSGNVSKTARKLNLHRQSLLYRLRKIETLTGKSLVNPDDLFLLEFAVKLWSTDAITSTK